MSWSKDLTIQLIESFREKRVLWDQGHKHYKDRQRKHVAWDELGAGMEMDPIVVEKKMRMLIGQFQREFKKGKFQGESDYKSKWTFLKPLLFLKGRTDQRYTNSTGPDLSFVPVVQDITDNGLSTEMGAESRNQGALHHSKISVAVQPTQRPITDQNAYHSRLNINTVDIKEEPISLVESSLSPLPIQQQLVIGKRANSPEDSEESNLEYFKIKRLKEETELADPDMNFFVSVLPDVRSMNPAQKRKMKIGLLKLIDEILV